MAGYSEIYCIGLEGGFAGADGVGSILLQILVGDADRQWLEPHYLSDRLAPLAGVKRMVPAGPNSPDKLLDACILFFPDHFKACPSLAEAAKAIEGRAVMDFDRDGEPPNWIQLRKEARSCARNLAIWRASLERVRPADL